MSSNLKLLAGNLAKITSPHATLETAHPLGALMLDDSHSGLGEFKEICWQYLHKLPFELQVGQISCSDEPLQNLRNFEFNSLLFQNGQMVGQMMVALYRPSGADSREVYLELEQGQIWERRLRNKGLGKAIMQNTLELGKALGVRAVTAFAMNDGRYVWSRLGFKFGDYLPDEKKARYYRKAFRAYCRRYGVTPPPAREMNNWDAPDFARFDPGVLVSVALGGTHDRKRKLVPLGMAFMMTRRPFFLCYPLS